MSELISGKEALIALANGGDVQYKCDNDPSIQDRWTTITNHYLAQYNLELFLGEKTTWKFKLKPKTITLNGVEIAPWKSIAINNQTNEIIIEYKDNGNLQEAFRVLKNELGRKG